MTTSSGDIGTAFLEDVTELFKKVAFSMFYPAATQQQSSLDTHNHSLGLFLGFPPHLTR